MQENAISDYNDIVKPLVAKYSQFNAEFCTLENYLNICSVVASRAFYVDSFHEDSLVPLADMYST